MPERPTGPPDTPRGRPPLYKRIEGEDDPYNRPELQAPYDPPVRRASSAMPSIIIAAVLLIIVGVAAFWWLLP